jgi:hypothetical protein
MRRAVRPQAEVGTVGNCNTFWQENASVAGFCLWARAAQSLFLAQEAG